uniref:Uncharacterized protein n=1 Tax=Physcomitrium patens TaxID=3218 RepID=A0A2K1JCK9_PHYPA|nr:hypothetical protein PHYPA_019542 [Physcomitrium patens]
MSSRLGCCGYPPARVIGLVNASEYKAYMAHSSGDDFEDAESISFAIPECEGLPRRLWITKCVTLYNAHGKLVGEDTCHSVNSDLVLGANGPLGDTQVAVHICKTHSQDDIP